VDLFFQPNLYLWNIIFTFYYTRVRPQCDYSILWRLENLLQNWSIGSIVGARPTHQPSNGRRDNTAGIMTIWWTSPPPISADSLTAPSCHGHSFPCSSSAPCNSYRYCLRFWDHLHGPIRLGLCTEVCLWSQFQIYLIGQFSSISGC